MGVVLECRRVTKMYGGLAAVRDVSFTAEAGDIFGIMGPNGAGKTSLFDLISGHARCTSGAVHFFGREIQHLPPEEVCRRGLFRTFQTPVVFGTQTALANVLVGALFGQPAASLFRLRFRAAEVARAAGALHFAGLAQRQGDLAANLSVFDKKRLMIASAMAAEPRALLLDEPFGGLNRSERDEMGALILKVKAAGVTVLLIEHVMKSLLTLADRLLILHHGEKLTEGLPADVVRDPRVVQVYLGRKAAELAGLVKGAAG